MACKQWHRTCHCEVGNVPKPAASLPCRHTTNYTYVLALDGPLPKQAWSEARFDCGSQAIGHSPKFQQQHLPLDWFRPSWAGLSARGRPNAESRTVQHSASSEFCWDCQISHSRNVHVFPPHLSPSLHKSPLRQPQKRVPPLGVATHHHQRTTDLVP